MKNFLLLTILFFTFITASCKNNISQSVSTESSEPVIHTDAINETDSPESESNGLTFSEEINNPEDTVKINIDLSLASPQTSLSIYRCRPRDITMDEIKQWAHVFFGKNMVFEPQTQQLQAEFQAEAKLYENGLKGTLNSYNRTEDDFLMHSIGFNYSDPDAVETYLPEKYLNEDEAEQAARDIISKLGFENWALDSSTPLSPDPQNNQLSEEYVFRFVPQYDQMKALYYPMTTVKSDDANAAHYYYEHLSVVIQRGIVTSVSWFSPIKITGVEEENIQLIPGNEIYAILKDYMQTKYTSPSSIVGFSDIEEGLNVNIQLKNAELKMCRIKETDSDDFLIVPAWDFTGSVIMNDVPIQDNVTLAIINAVDGSIINGALGY